MPASARSRAIRRPVSAWATLRNGSRKAQCHRPLEPCQSGQGAAAFHLERQFQEIAGNLGVGDAGRCHTRRAEGLHCRQWQGDTGRDPPCGVGRRGQGRNLTGGQGDKGCEQGYAQHQAGLLYLMKGDFTPT